VGAQAGQYVSSLKLLYMRQERIAASTQNRFVSLYYMQSTVDVHLAVLQIMLMTQYLDTLKDLGVNGRSSTVFLPHGPGAICDMASQIRRAWLLCQSLCHAVTAWVMLLARFWYELL
jgi:hypothetical protein